MRLAGIKAAVAVSILIHIAFVSFSYSIMKRGTFQFPPLPYTVTLVAAEEEGAGEGEGKGAVEAMEAGKLKAVTMTEKAVLPVKNTPAPERDYIKDRNYIEDRLAVFSGKKRVAEKVRAKKELISLSSSSSSSRTQKTGENSSLSGSGNYPDRLGAAIKRLWFFPAADGKGLEAVVSIRVLKNGVIEIGGFFKKSSGNQLFDDSALRAIKKASPFAPPPYEMEIDVRFVNED